MRENPYLEKLLSRYRDLYDGLIAPSLDPAVIYPNQDTEDAEIKRLQKHIDVLGDYLGADRAVCVASIYSRYLKIGDQITARKASFNILEVSKKFERSCSGMTSPSLSRSEKIIVDAIGKGALSLHFGFASWPFVNKRNPELETLTNLTWTAFVENELQQKMNLPRLIYGVSALSDRGFMPASLRC